MLINYDEVMITPGVITFGSHALPDLPKHPSQIKNTIDLDASQSRTHSLTAEVDEDDT